MEDVGNPQIGAMSVRCSRCHKTWPSNLTACPEDGASFRLDDAHGDAAEASAEEFCTETGKTGSFSGQDYTTVDATSHSAGVGPTAIARPFSGTPTPLAVVGPISSGEITAQSPQLAASTPAPAAEASSNLDPTGARKLALGSVHLVPGTLVGEYEIEKLLGSGGMGAVYGARHVRLGRRAAIKVISPALSVDIGAVERFEQEAIALARLSHPNIVNVVNVGTLPGDGRSYFIMEWLAGTSLQDRLERGRLDLDDALDIVDQIARGLDAAHAAGVIHRDLKPDNVWLQQVGTEPRPIAKLLDFGLAKLGQHRRTEHTATNVMFGTPQFMSPEQCQSARDVGPPTDVYALGCLMFELLTGRLPFTYDNSPELIVAHQTEEPPRARDLEPAIDPQIDALLFAMLAKDPGRRPSLISVRSEIAESRRRLASGSGHERSLPSATRPNAAAADPATPTRGPRRAVVAAGAAVLLLVFVLMARLALKTAGDDSGRHAVVPSIDASNAPPSLPIRSTASETRVETPADDVGGPVMKPARTHEAPSTKVVRKQLDAGIEVRDAAAAVTVEDARAFSDGSGSQPPTSVPAQATRPPISSPETPKIDRNQTFNPFEKRPASR